MGNARMTGSLRRSPRGYGNKMHEAMLYEKVKDKTVRCTACRQFCVIADGLAGLCGVRLNRDGRLYLLVYGKTASAGIDPVEKKPLFHFLPGTPIFSIGTVGCNFGCTFCQNWTISQATRELRLRLMKEKKPELMEAKVDELGYALSPQAIVESCVEKRIRSIAYTYNEPAVFFEYAYDTSKLAHEKGIKNVFVSNGYESEEALRTIRPYLEAMNIDLKSFSDDFYRKICQARLNPVLETIRLAHKLGIWIELTTLIIPGKNDSDDELRQIAGFIAGLDKDVPWHLSAFYPCYKMTDVPSTDRSALEKAYAIGREAGLRYVYVGNVIDTERSSTCCPECGALLIRRVGFSADVEQLRDSRCTKCGMKIPGVWK